MGGLAGASGAFYEVDSMRPVGIPGPVQRRVSAKQGAKRGRPLAAEEHERQREDGWGPST
jgi:hypothetical protein